jgi:hypothetical protein
VLRWTWRVGFYSYSALATDRYPPFTLAGDPDYPARLTVTYPESLSRVLALVKWWLLALPHYLVVAMFAGGASVGWSPGNDSRAWTTGGGLISLLVGIADIILLTRGRYPRGLFNLILGLDRWICRVAAYATLMTDTYPPFRLDTGGHEPPSRPVATSAASGVRLAERRPYSSGRCGA